MWITQQGGKHGHTHTHKSTQQWNQQNAWENRNILTRARSLCTFAWNDLALTSARVKGTHAHTQAYVMNRGSGLTHMPKDGWLQWFHAWFFYKYQRIMLL